MSRPESRVPPPAPVPIHNFTVVTELPSSGATPDQLMMLYTRYHLAARLGSGKAVLEVACGPGLGLGLMSKYGRLVVAGDYDWNLVRQAKAHYGDRAGLFQLDAQALPFADKSFDVVALLEAIYYLAAPDRFIYEARRILRPGGTLLVCTANRESPGFTPSRHARRYPSVPQLCDLLQAGGFSVEIYGGHPVRASTARDRAILIARRAASALHLIPPTLGGRRVLKRIVYGRLVPIPPEIFEGMTEPGVLVPLHADKGTSEFRVLYAVGKLP